MPHLLTAAEQLDPDYVGGVHPARRRRRVRDRARVVERAGDEELGRAGRVECVEGKVVERMKGAVADAG